MKKKKKQHGMHGLRNDVGKKKTRKNPHKDERGGKKMCCQMQFLSVVIRLPTDCP